jgi:hypothetical protein
MKASVEEQNFVFDAVKVDIVAAENTVPGMFRGYVSQYLTDEIILHMVNTAINAVDTFRANQEKTS